MRPVQRTRPLFTPAAIAVVILALAAGSLLTACSTAAPAVDDAAVVPDTPLVPLTGGPETTLRALAGRPAVVNLWASWCPPCVAEMPDLEAQHRHYGDRVNFVGVTDDADPDAASRLASRLGVTYPLLHDPAGVVLAELGIANLPATVFVDAEGRMVAKRLGRVTREDIDNGLAPLLGSGGSQP
jgi:cytochrome c biogenesis protein CcmG, thiol:disulfide interchange protein DsbE